MRAAMARTAMVRTETETVEALLAAGAAGSAVGVPEVDGPPEPVGVGVAAPDWFGRPLGVEPRYKATGLTVLVVESVKPQTRLVASVVEALESRRAAEPSRTYKHLRPVPSIFMGG